MLETSKTIKFKHNQERGAGTWFPFTNNKYLLIVEYTGRSIAFSIRGLPFLHKNIGTNSIKWWMIIGAFLWVRLWVLISLGFDQYHDYFNPFIFAPWEALILNVLSYASLVFAIYYKVLPFYRFAIKQEDVKTGNWGEPSLLDYELEQKSFVQKNWFKQIIVEPLVIGIFGFLLFRINGFDTVGLFLLVSSIPFFIDALSHHVGKGRVIIGQRENMGESEKTAKTHEEIDQSKEDDFYYDE